jgi:hypothetical protein
MMDGKPEVDAKSRISLKINFKSEEEARNIGGALKIDDDEFVTTIIEDSMVRGEVEADSIRGARRAADDWLACLMAILREK